MKIYVGHSKRYDFQKELYCPIRNDEINQRMEIVLPHEEGVHHETKQEISSYDYMIAEVSCLSTGLGMELGYADMFDVPIIIAYKTDAEISPFVRNVAVHEIEYKNSDELLEKIKAFLDNPSR